MPFVTEEIWSLRARRARACSWPRRARAPTRRCVDADAEAEVGRADRADPGAARLARRRRRRRPATRVPARLAAEGYERAAELVAPPRAVRVRRPDGGEPVASVAGPGRRVASALGRLDAEAAPSAGSAAPRRAARRRSSAPSASSATRASSPRRRPAVVEAERDKLERLPRGAASSEELDLDLRRGRALPALARAVRHAVRPRPHAPADDRAGPARSAASPRSTSSAPTASPRPCG